MADTSIDIKRMFFIMLYLEICFPLKSTERLPFFMPIYEKEIEECGAKVMIVLSGSLYVSMSLAEARTVRSSFIVIYQPIAKPIRTNSDAAMAMYRCIGLTTAFSLSNV